MAIKVLRPDFADNDPNGRLRLRREALTSCSFNHKNVVRLIDFGTSRIQTGNNGRREYYDELYIVMELVEGETLKDHLAKEGQLTFSEAIEITLQIAEALVEVHWNGVVHRDIKPANVMLTYDRDGLLVVKLLDFGAVKLFSQAATTPLPDLDLTGQMFIGSPQYASPESCLFKPLDARSDLYCLGLILYEMVAGRPPFQATDVVDWLSKHAHSRPRSLVGAPTPLADFVRKVLSKSPSDRPQSAVRFLESLRQISKSLQPIANQKAPPPNESDEVESDSKDEITRVAAAAMAGAEPGPITLRPKPPTRTIAGSVLLLLSLTASVFLTLAFLREVLTYTPVENPADEPTNENRTVGEFVTTTDVNIRMHPSGLSEKVGLAEKGSRVRVLEKHKNWRRIIVIQHGRDNADPASRDQGWIDGNNLTVLNDSTNGGSQ